MHLKPNTIITLENQKRYLVLNETEWNQKKYFLVMEVDQKKEVIPANVAIFSEIVDVTDCYVEKVEDSDLIMTLTKQFKAQM